MKSISKVLNATKITPLRAIRRHCLACNSTAQEVRLCPAETCSLFKHRLGMGRGRYLKAIRAKCVDCAENVTVIRNCPTPDCNLYIFRMGINPYRIGTRPRKQNAVISSESATRRGVFQQTGVSP